MMLLNGVDKKRYGTLIDELNNYHLLGESHHPKNMESMLSMLTHYTVPGKREQNKVSKDKDKDSMGSIQANFAQDKVKVCYICGEEGHFSIDCPEKNEIKKEDYYINKVRGSNVQVVEEAEADKEPICSWDHCNWYG